MELVEQLIGFVGYSWFLGLVELKNQYNQVKGNKIRSFKDKTNSQKSMDMKEKLEKVQQQVKRYYRKINQMSGGAIGIIRVTLTRFGEERGSEAAASLAYYAFFSIFPMLLVFIVVGSFFVDTALVETQLLELLEGVLPGAETLVIENINEVLRLRGSVTIVALVSLTWSATSVFNILAKNINRAFKKAVIPDFFKGRLYGLFMFIGLGLLMVLSLTATTIIGLIPIIDVPIDGLVLHETLLWRLGALITPVVINVLMFWAIYQWIPTITVKRRAALMGGLVAGITWEMLNNTFTWYLSSGLVQYRLVYGSLGSIVALLFYVYLTATLVLIGAHLTATIHNYKVRTDEQKT